MAESDAATSCPRDVNESNIAMDAIMKELTQRLNFGSRTLIHGQEDILTLSEYEALFEVDMKICENALDLLIALGKQQKMHLEAMVAAKRLERSLPSVINEALTRATAEITNADELRRKVKAGDFSFFADNVKNKQSSSDMPSSSVATDISNEPVLARVCGSVEECTSEQKRTAQTSLPSMSSGSSVTMAFRKRERPQFSSDAARRVLGEMNLLEEMHRSGRKPSSSGYDQSHEKQAKISVHDISSDRNMDEARLNGKHISASGGCSLDGSIMDFGENSGQNGLRAYSPVYDIPPQPNFDESDVYSFSESVPMHSAAHIASLKGEAGDEVRLKSTSSNESMKFALKGAANVPSQTREEHTKTNAVPSEPAWLSSSYVPRARPKFSSTVGRMFNQE